jgi:hypothetical protein
VRTSSCDLISQWVSKDIEQYKADLSKEVERYRAELDSTSRVAITRLEADLRRAAFEHETRFARLHEKPAKIIADLYRLLMVAFREVEHFVHPMHWTGEPSKEEQYLTAMNALAEFARYYDQRRIFLPHELSERLDAFARALRLPALHLASYIRIEHPTPEVANEKYDVWHKAWDTIQKDSTAARVALENEFRKLLSGH